VLIESAEDGPAGNRGAIQIRLTATAAYEEI
jgi:hypothetical protein